MTKVSVLMSVYNGEKYIGEAIASVLAQTEADLELVIVNDGSSDGTDRVIRSYADERIRYVDLPHRGRVSALNAGIVECRGEYVAILDADDVFAPEKLREQLRYMEDHALDLCGTWATVIDDKDRTMGEIVYPPIEMSAIRRYSLLHNPFIHSSAMVRRDVLVTAGSYRAYRYAEDYELWTRIMYKHPIGNLPEKLVSYRRHTSQLTQESGMKVRFDAILMRILVLWRFLFRM